MIQGLMIGAGILFALILFAGALAPLWHRGPE